MNKDPLLAYGIRRFLRDCWQKKPLLLRGVAPGLADALSRDDLIDMACRDDIESRLVIGSGKRWQVRHGPFRRRDFAKLPSRNWTLLVNGVDTLVPAANALQMRFGFVPYARQDDVMVSYAAPGGGVGAHFDSYDVFLLQGAGTRRWQISRQRDLALIDGAPLKILSRFRAQHEWRVNDGDMLYLPPHYAHHGVAIGECMTWSIGMRAPQPREMAARFLDYLQDHVNARGVYSDPGLQAQTHRAEIGAQMHAKVRGMIRAIRWSDADIDRCLGEMLSEPRQHVVFEPPPPLGLKAFARTVANHGLRLDMKSRLLFDHRMFYMNGEAVALPRSGAAALKRLADERALRAGTPLGQAMLVLLYRWHAAGYLQTGSPD